MNERKIIIAHNDRKFIENAMVFFQDNNRYIVDRVVKSGEELLRLNNLDGYHIVIVKDALSEISGLYALKKLLINTKKYPENILLLTPFINNFVLSYCNKLQIIPVKINRHSKITMQNIYKIIYKQVIIKDVKNNKIFDAKTEISYLLNRIGLLKSYIGFRYFEYIFNILLNDDYKFKYLKNIYDNIAQYYNVSPISVEKAMRTCIKSSFSHNYGYYASLLFGNTKTIPTISTFIQICLKTLHEKKNYIIKKKINL